MNIAGQCRCPTDQIVTEVKSGRHVGRQGMHKEFLARTQLTQRPIGKPRIRLENNIKMDGTGIDLGGHLQSPQEIRLQLGAPQSLLRVFNDLTDGTSTDLIEPFLIYICSSPAEVYEISKEICCRFC